MKEKKYIDVTIPTFMLNKRLIIFILIFIVVILVWIYIKNFLFSPATPISNSLSPRSQEFLTTQREKGNTIWNTINTSTDSVDTQRSQTFITTCFSVTLPFEIKDIQTSTYELGCRADAQIVGSLGRVAVTSKKSDIELSEDSAVKLRQTQKETYTEEQIVLNSGESLIVFRSSDSVSIFFSRKETQLVIAFSNLLHPEEITSEKIRVMIETSNLL